MSSPIQDPGYTYYKVGHVDDFIERVGRLVRLGDLEIAVFKTSDGDVYALDNKSPGPKGGTLVEGIISETTLFDPICDWRIRLTDGQVLDPDTGQVKTYPVYITENTVRIGLSTEGGESTHG